MATNQNPNQNQNQNQQSKQNMSQGQQQDRDQIGNRSGQSIPANQKSSQQDSTVMKNANPKKADRQMEYQDEFSAGNEDLSNDVGGKNPKENSH